MLVGGRDWGWTEEVVAQGPPGVTRLGANARLGTGRHCARLGVLWVLEDLPEATGAAVAQGTGGGCARAAAACNSQTFPNSRGSERSETSRRG